MLYHIQLMDGFKHTYFCADMERVYASKEVFLFGKILLMLESALGVVSHETNECPSVLFTLPLILLTLKILAETKNVSSGAYSECEESDFLAYPITTISYLQKQMIDSLLWKWTANF